MSILRCGTCASPVHPPPPPPARPPTQTQPHECKEGVRRADGKGAVFTGDEMDGKEAVTEREEGRGMACHRVRRESEIASHREGEIDETGVSQGKGALENIRMMWSKGGKEHLAEDQLQPRPLIVVELRLRDLLRRRRRRGRQKLQRLGEEEEVVDLRGRRSPSATSPIVATPRQRPLRCPS
jgi:hypothetical protein